MTPESLRELASVNLEQLNETASLLTRVDRKYLAMPGRHGGLWEHLVDQVLGPLGGQVLEINGGREFTYRTIYFDTPDNASFRGAAHRRRRRFKVRLRHYLDTGEARLEVKIRGRRGTTVKEQLAVDVTDTLNDEDRAFIDERLRAAHIRGIDVNELHQSLTTQYRRSTILLPDHDTRLTLDSDLGWTSPNGRNLGTGGLLVIETKTPVHAPDPVDRALWASSCRPVSFSKYATGRVLMDPTLPSNRWHRVIQRDLAPPQTSEDFRPRPG